MRIITRYFAQGLASTLGLWAAVVLMTVLADVMFYRQPGGWSVATCAIRPCAHRAFRNRPGGCTAPSRRG